MTVGLALLSRLEVDTSTVVAGAYMLVLGLGLGMVMQVLVLAAQNAVDYQNLGVATSGSTLFRQIGGSIGVAIFGAIFANQLAANLARQIPPGTTLPAAVDPVAIKHLPAALHDLYVTALTDSLQPVFLTAAAIAVFAFVLTWFLREVPLRTSSRRPTSARAPALARRRPGPRGRAGAVAVGRARGALGHVRAALHARAGRPGPAGALAALTPRRASAVDPCRAR